MSDPASSKMQKGLACAPCCVEAPKGSVPWQSVERHGISVPAQSSQGLESYKGTRVVSGRRCLSGVPGIGSEVRFLSGSIRSGV